MSNIPIIGATFKNTSRVYSYYCTVDDVKVGDMLLTPDDTVVTVAQLDVDPATISERVIPLMKTITKRAEESVEVVADSTETVKTDLMVVTQLPVIEENLKQLGDELQREIDLALSLPCTEENKAEVKRVRAKLNKKKAEFEAKRIAVKNAIMEPYERVNDLCKTYVLNRLTDADSKLGKRISDIEDAEKTKKRAEVEAFYLDALAAHGLDFPTFDKSGIKVGISDSVASLKRQASEFAAKTAEEVAAISGLPYADEIMVEYRASLNSPRSITTINERHKALEAQRARMETVQPAFEPVPVAPVVPRVIVPTHGDDEVTKTIRVVGSQRKIDALLKFLEDGWYKYEVEA